MRLVLCFRRSFCGALSTPAASGSRSCLGGACHEASTACRKQPIFFAQGKMDATKRLNPYGVYWAVFSKMGV